MDAILDYLLNSHDKLLYIVAGISLLVELTMIGLSGPLLFFSIGCALTGILVSFNVISSWELEVLCVGLFTLFSAIILWKPLKRIQGTKSVVDNSSDMIGQVVPISNTVTINGGTVRYSGINWSARLIDSSEVAEIKSGERGVIKSIDGNILLIDTIPS